MSTTASANEITRRAFLKLNDETVLRTVDALDLRGNSKLSAVVGFPLRTLQQRRDVTAFAVSSPIAALKGLLELLAMEPLERVIAALGDHADNPTFEQLSAALDTVTNDGASNDDVVAVLCFAVAEGFPAAGSCRRLLLERPEFELPELPEPDVTPSVVAPRELDTEKREQRRARREQEKLRKKGPSSTRPSRPAKTKPATAKHSATNVAPVVAVPEAESRRRFPLTPAELDRFSPDHPLVGSVIIVDVPFDAADPTTPEATSKERPALVVAASEAGVLVRAIYSSPGPTRSLFGPWRRVGLDHVSYIDGLRVALGVEMIGLARVGQVTTQEWNALI